MFITYCFTNTPTDCTLDSQSWAVRDLSSRQLSFALRSPLSFRSSFMWDKKTETLTYPCGSYAQNLDVSCVKPKGTGARLGPLYVSTGSIRKAGCPVFSWAKFSKQKAPSIRYAWRWCRRTNIISDVYCGSGEGMSISWSFIWANVQTKGNAETKGTRHKESAIACSLYFRCMCHMPLWQKISHPTVRGNYHVVPPQWIWNS